MSKKKDTTPVEPAVPEAPTALAFTASARELGEALKAVAPYVNAKSSIAVLSCVLIESVPTDVPAGYALRLSTTDMEAWVEFTQAAEVTTPGRVLVPLKDLRDVLAACGKDEAIKLTTDLANSKAHESNGGSFATTIRTYPVDDFPLRPWQELDHTKTITLQADSLVKALEWTTIAISRDETRPILASLNLSVKGEVVSLVATDSYRLHVMSVEPSEAWDLPDGDYPLPGAFVRSFAKQFRKLVQFRLTFSFGFRNADDTTPDSCLIYDQGPMTWRTRVQAGIFPRYEQLIPDASSWSIYATMETADLKPVIAAMSKMGGTSAKYGNTPMRLKLARDANDNWKATFAYTPTDKPSIEFTIPADVKEAGELDKTFEIGLNPAFACDALRGMERAAIAAISPLRPIRFNPDLDMTKMGILMPIRLDQ